MNRTKFTSGTQKTLSLHLSAFGKLSEAERNLIETVLKKRVRVLPARYDVVREGDESRVVHVVLDGWAQRYKQLADGRRQILTFFVAGDLCDPNVFVPRTMDHSISTITPVRLAEIPKPDFREMIQASPNIAQALWWISLVTVAIQREWTTSIGQRTAYERIAHLFCEMFVRLRTVGLTQGAACDFPLTQSDIAEATGLTQVHVNRTIQEMRRDGLVELRHRQLVLPDLDRLMSVALFSASYLHLDHIDKPMLA
ncbi:cyclic nucleotide-binding protein [Novosphingobium sp. Leaf2]|nr:cyclic nucleotide-binding protein [Novosphingobium sp. Leaf2]